MGNICLAEGCREDAGGGRYCPYCSQTHEHDDTPPPKECAWCDESFSLEVPKYTTAQVANGEHGGEGCICAHCYAAQHGLYAAVQADGVIYFTRSDASLSFVAKPKEGAE
jgi:hypothetical protein